MISLTSPVETRAHGWPAGVKLAALCAATMMLFAVHSAVLHLMFFAIVLGLYALPGRAFARNGLRRLWMLWPFVALILLWHGLRGEPVQGMAIALRMITAVGLATLVTMTTSLSAMMEVVRVLSTPLRRFGVSTKGVELAVALVVRFTPELLEKAAQLRQSWRARSCGQANWHIVLPFAVLAIDDAEHVAEALKARGGV